MPMKDINLVQINPSNRAEGKFTVTIYSDDGQLQATFDCDSEHAALTLRSAIREHATQLRSVANYRG